MVAINVNKSAAVGAQQMKMLTAAAVLRYILVTGALARFRNIFTKPPFAAQSFKTAVDRCSSYNGSLLRKRQAKLVRRKMAAAVFFKQFFYFGACLLYTSPSPRYRG